MVAIASPDEPRRNPRRSRPVDVSHFATDIDNALRAFTDDVTYAVAMARSAVTIVRKRGVWQARRDARAAESAAHAECRNAKPFTCLALSPCGTGDCKYAQGEMTLLDIPDADGPTARPQASRAGRYSIESVVEPLIALRASRQ